MDDLFLTYIDKLSENCQNNLKIMAGLIQSMCRDFEELADSCKNANGFGGCRKQPDGCQAVCCPLPNEKEVK